MFLALPLFCYKYSFAVLQQYTLRIRHSHYPAREEEGRTVLLYFISLAVEEV